MKPCGNKSLIKDLLEGKKNCCYEAAVVIADLDKEIMELKNFQLRFKETNKKLVRDLDECQRAHDKLAGISNEG